jgi:thiamine-phosphate pyrophosphorylase
VKPVICMITDRRRLASGDGEALVRRVAAAARAGVQLVQLRERDLDGRPLWQLAAACVGAVRGTPARVLVNDRLDVAIAAGAHGVHLRGDSMAAARVRRLVPAGFLIGRSIHSLAEARDAAQEGAVDYLIFGTMFPTSAKPGATPQGLEALAQVAAATTIPVLAVGGITRDTAGRLAAAGAAGVAAIGLFAAGREDRLHDEVAALARAFDTPETVP